MSQQHLYSPYAIGAMVRAEYDGFIGTVIGHYVTREGHAGAVVQDERNKVVHVYREKHLSLVMRTVGDLSDDQISELSLTGAQRRARENG